MKNLENAASILGISLQRLRKLLARKKYPVKFIGKKTFLSQRVLNKLKVEIKWQL
jgi:hypothetical protein